MEEAKIFQVIIIGSGCAGHTAAIYSARADLNPLVIEGDEAGGQLTQTSEVENFPGFPEGVDGFDLVDNMRRQAEKFGAHYHFGQVSNITHDGRYFTLELRDEDKSYTAKTVIIATGATAKRLNIPGESELFGQGVSSCATCDGAFFRDKTVAVVGGGDSAMEEALFLTKYASQVHLIHRREELRASKIMQDRALEHPKINFIPNTEITAVVGDEETNLVSFLQLISHPDGNPGQRNPDQCTTRELSVDGLFLGIGHTPNSSFLGSLVNTDEEGYVQTLKQDYLTSDVITKTPGLFACGDVVDKRYRQAITAAAMGCKAAIEAEQFLEHNHHES